jgi:hypothetical protein
MYNKSKKSEVATRIKKACTAVACACLCTHVHALRCAVRDPR